MNTSGSSWNKWDLHVHTPESFEWRGEKFQNQTTAQKDASCKAVLDKMNDLDVAVFCIMDYWTFEGYIALREYITRHPQACKKRILPGMEFRLLAPTKFRLNSHVILSDELSTASLRHFVSEMRLAHDQAKPPLFQHFVDLARTYDEDQLRLYECTTADRADEGKMALAGMKSGIVTKESIDNAIASVGKENCITMQPYDTSDGLDGLEWNKHPYAYSYLMKWADSFECRNPISVGLFLGHGHPTKPNVGPAFIDNIGGSPKPVFSGSDAHQVGHYGVYPSGRVTWLKAQPTFKGLRQVCHEPTLRCFIGALPPKLEHVRQNPAKYIRSLKLAKTPTSNLIEHWFDGTTLTFNPGLVAIIGNKGSGKSALADIIALSGNSQVTSMEFLTDKRFRRGGNKAKHFHASLEWADHSLSEVFLNQPADKDRPERVRYLPQHFIETLCNDIAEGKETEFDKELKKVIFAHVPVEDQLSLGSLDDLLQFLVESRKRAVLQLQQSLAGLNEAIVRHEQEISDSTLKGYQTSLALKRQELEALAKPSERDKPPEDLSDPKSVEAAAKVKEKQATLEQVQIELAARRQERGAVVIERSTLIRLLGHLDTYEAAYRDFVRGYGPEFESAGFDIEQIVPLTINRDVLQARLAEVQATSDSVRKLIEGEKPDAGPPVFGLEHREAVLIVEIAKLKEKLNAPQKEYQAYLAELATWTARRAAIQGAPDKTDTIEFFEARIKWATEGIPRELEKQYDERRTLVRRIHAELLQIRDAYERLYAPVQKIASSTSGVAGALQLEFKANISTHKFSPNFLDFIHKAKKGTFQGDEESQKAVMGLIDAHEFANTEDVVAFTEAVFAALRRCERNGEVEAVAVESQLRVGKTTRQLYDFLFGLGYVDIQYTLRLGDKDISQLSPGEKGALLLVFYLLLDTEEIPIIIDQPEHNLDNESVVRLLVDCIRKTRDRRQVMIVTHNPNLAVFCDADQMIYCKLDKSGLNKCSYSTGAIEDYDINQITVNVLEGTYPAFDNRRRKYHRPEPDYSLPVMSPGEVT